MSESSLMNAEVVSCHIDLGRELSIMHGILKEHIHKLSNVSKINFGVATKQCIIVCSKCCRIH